MFCELTVFVCFTEKLHWFDQIESRVKYGTEWHVKIYSSSDVVKSADNYVGEHFPPQQDMLSQSPET